MRESHCISYQFFKVLYGEYEVATSIPKQLCDRVLLDLCINFLYISLLSGRDAELLFNTI